MGDAVKGKNYFHFNKALQKGILLHRYIDTTTDTHPVTREMRSMLRKDYGIFSGIIIDIFYDYFLATNWSRFHHEDLKKYTQYKYALLMENNSLMPDKTKLILSYMIQHDWLFQYQFTQGIEHVLRGMEQRISSNPVLHTATSLLISHQNVWQEMFIEFFSDMIVLTADFLHKK